MLTTNSRNLLYQLDPVGPISITCLWANFGEGLRESLPASGAPWVSKNRFRWQGKHDLWPSMASKFLVFDGHSVWCSVFGTVVRPPFEPFSMEWRQSISWTGWFKAVVRCLAQLASHVTMERLPTRLNFGIGLGHQWSTENLVCCLPSSALPHHMFAVASKKCCVFFAKKHPVHLQKPSGETGDWGIDQPWSATRGASASRTRAPINSPSVPRHCSKQFLKKM